MAATPPAVLREGGGVVLEYANGSTCKGEQKWKTVLVLSCDRDIPTVSIPISLMHVYIYTMYLHVGKVTALGMLCCFAFVFV